MKTISFLGAFILAAITTMAQSTGQKSPIVAYGDPITLEAAKKLAAASEKFAIEKQWTIIVAIVDTGGNLVLLQKMDNTQIGSIDVAIAKAKTANAFKRPTKTFEDGIAAGGSALRILNVPGITPVEGGEPIYSDGKIIGAIGISGMSSVQDGEVVKAAMAVSK
ncbi:MAG TPA: heme-binding protein [Chryseolinea sp.]|nr:heme-binding protein [Chryseolinea sp.]